MSLSELLALHDPWQEFTKKNSAALIGALNPTDLILQEFHSKKLLTHDYYEKIKSIPEQQLQRRSRELVDIMHNGSDRFATKEKLTILIEILQDRQVDRPCAAKIFQAFLAREYGLAGQEKAVEKGEAGAEKVQKNSALLGATFKDCKFVGTALEGDVNISGPINL